ncbi:MAG: hypothetical protein GX137_06560 [Thermoplasmatales archaeon]|jgi:PAS domain-containing protein|nr:hypothetical protein [Thermoplasmatales archaeon]
MMRDYAEDILNVVLDEIDDIILIHDSEHTLVWMNRAGLLKFDVTLEGIIGERCYTLFGRNKHCDDCKIVGTAMRKDSRKRVMPSTGEIFDCHSVPLYKDGKIDLVVQHLTLAEKTGKQ